MRNILILLIACCCFCTSAWAQPPLVGSLLPADTAGWHLSESPQLFVGDELFKMIDGGAALYQEYGFDRAISGKYEDHQGRGVDAEVYEMNDPEAACGILGITGASGEKMLQVGDEGEMGEYFLVFRKGRHVVTVSGQAADPATMDGVKSIGRAIETRIDSSSRTPPFIAQFNPLVTAGTRPVFLRGVIGVGNFYFFAPQNVFGVHEGITGERDSTRFFVFRYQNAKGSAQALHTAGKALRANDKYSRFQPASDSLTMADRDGNLLRATSVRNTIVVVIGRNESVVRKLEMDVKATLNRL